MDINIQLCLETPAHYRAVEEITRDAFWGLSGVPGCDEHYLVHCLRQSPAFIPELAYVAESGGQVVGNIMYSKAAVLASNGQSHPVLTFGPLTVAPAYQNKGIGRRLVEVTAKKAAQMGHRAIVIFGEPDYYPRLGFLRAGEQGITTKEGTFFDAFMVLPLYEGALKGLEGRYIEDPVFHINAEKAAAYDGGFPKKDEARLTPISTLVAKLGQESAAVFAAKNIETINILHRFSGREIARWEGMRACWLPVIAETLAFYGLPPKKWPAS